MKLFAIIMMCLLLNLFIPVKAQVYEGTSKPETFKLQKKTKSVVVASDDDQIDNNQTVDADMGRNFAIIIGIAQYQDEGINKLEEPVKDAKKFYDILVNNYTFEKENIIFLENPSSEDIYTAFDNIKVNINSNDNLLIFYAGHGYWDESLKVGYWIPADAKISNTAKWFRNSTIKDYIGGIPSKHTLLIADACFGGSIFKTRKAFDDAPKDIKQLYELPSRKAMTSGTLIEVPDKSVFLMYLVKRLTQNQDKYLSALDLFSSIRTPVINNCSTVPQYGEIKETGDEGGEFIFVKREVKTNN